MNGFFKRAMNQIKTAINPVWAKLRLFTNSGFLKTKLWMPLKKFLGKVFRIRPKDENDYYGVFGWLISKRLVLFLVLFIGILSAFYVLKIQPLSVFVSDEHGIKTYSYDSIPLRFMKGKVKILGESGYVAYIGDVEQGAANGNGILYRKDGSKVYEGEFENNAFHGKGILYFSDTQIQYSGEFQENLYSGMGSLYRQNGSLEYTGSFFGGMKEGNGVLYDSGNNEIYRGNFLKDQPAYRDFIGKSTSSVNEIYLGEKKIYMNEEYFVVDLSDIDALYYGNSQNENLTDEIMIEGIYVLKDTFSYQGEQLGSVFEINRFFESPSFEGNSYVIFPEAVALHIMQQNGKGNYGEMITSLDQYLTDAVIVDEFNDNYGIYVYSYIQEDIRYTFFSEDKSGKFFMYLIEKEK